MLTFNYSTPEQLNVRLRERFMLAEGVEAAKIAAYFATLKSDELEAAFQDKQKAEVAAIKLRLDEYSGVYDQIKMAKGE